MKTFLIGLLTAGFVAVLVGIGLQWAAMPSATVYSTDNVRLTANG